MRQLLKAALCAIFVVATSVNSVQAQVNINDSSVLNSDWRTAWLKENVLPQLPILDVPTNMIGVRVMNYEKLNAIEVNGKLELGIELPKDIRARVADFVLSGSSQDQINPFDPEELDIVAHFEHVSPNNTLIRESVFGFYYQNFRRKGNLKEWTKINAPDDPEFRIRFTPKQTGYWICNVVVRTPKMEKTFHSGYFLFKVVSSEKSGFVEIGENKRYLELEGELFLPLGMNMPTQGDNLTGYRKNGANPAEYVTYLDALKELKNSGANYFRYMSTPWTTEIEFETLGDYSNRMPQAWEMDALVDEIEALDLRMHFNMSYTTPLTYTGLFSMFRWDWTSKTDMQNKCSALPGWLEDDFGYCYHSDSEFGVETIDEFLTNPESIRFYQNRIRYMVARWGYSTHIVAFELMNEINFSGVSYGLRDDCSVDPSIFEIKPYFKDTSYVRKLSEWQIEMARYMKQDLGLIDHPICVNFGGPPNYVESDNYHFDLEDGSSMNAGDHTYFSPYVDIMSYNDYFRWYEKYEYQSHDIKRLKLFGKANYRNASAYQKPLIFSEIGMGKHGCDDQFTFKQLYLMSPFSGALGAGLPWHYNNNMTDFDSTVQREDAWSIMPVVQDFFSDVPLNNGDWKAGFDVRGDRKAEILYLTERESSSERAVAVINNRTVNRYTMRENWCDENPAKCDCYLSASDLTHVSKVYQTPQAFNWKDGKRFGGAQVLKMDGMEYTSRYRIEFYDALTGDLVAEDTKWSDAIGQLKIRYPELAAQPNRSEENGNGSMLLVKVRKYDMPSFSEVSIK